MKRLTVICCIMALSFAMMACGKKAENETIVETEVTNEVVDDTMEQEETAETEVAEAEETTAGEAETVEESVAEEAATEAVTEENAAAEEAADEQTGGYEDNFAVDGDAAAEYAGKIKAAVAEQNLEALAELAAYPVYVGFADGGTPVNSKEEMLALGAERVFTPEMVESIAGADESTLSPSMAGFALSKDGRPNIIFGVVEGRLAIVGMNY